MNLHAAGGITDKALVTAALTAPWWVDHVNTVATVIIAVTGAIVGIIRLWIAIRDLRRGKRG